MRIDQSYLHQARVLESDSTKPSREVGSSGIAQQHDEATLTSDMISIGGMVSDAMNVPDVRQDKVDALRRALRSGEYKLEPAQIAHAMISEIE